MSTFHIMALLEKISRILHALRHRTERAPVPEGLPGKVIVTCVNSGYAKCGLLENWALHLARLGLTDHIVIGALDDEAERAARCLPGTVIRFNSDIAPRPDSGALRYRREGWKPIVFSKLGLVRSLLMSGRHVLFSDADVVFLKNPLAYFPGERVADFAAQSDAPAQTKSDSPRTLCSGLYFAHPTREAIETLRITVEEMNALGGDQDYLRLRLGVERTARCVMLPRREFPNGDVWRAAPPPDPVAVHFNWVEGVERKLQWVQECGLLCSGDT